MAQIREENTTMDKLVQGDFPPSKRVSKYQSSRPDQSGLNRNLYNELIEKIKPGATTTNTMQGNSNLINLAS